jgi:hypothetical protein
MTMRKLLFGTLALAALLLGQSGCGVLIPTCESFLESACQRRSACSSQDFNTQQQMMSQCMRSVAPETTCRYLTAQQNAEFDSITRNDCHNRVKTSVCTDGGGIDTGPTCNQIINNFFSTLSN